MIVFVCSQKEVLLLAEKKMGRPTDEPKNNQQRIRMSDKDIEILEYCCEKTGMTKADVIRTGIKMVYDGLKK